MSTRSTLFRCFQKQAQDGLGLWGWVLFEVADVLLAPYFVGWGDSSVLQEEGEHIQVFSHESRVQDGRVISVTELDICAMFQECLHKGAVAIRNGDVKWVDRFGSLRLRIEDEAFFDQHLEEGNILMMDSIVVKVGVRFGTVHIGEGQSTDEQDQGVLGQRADGDAYRFVQLVSTKEQVKESQHQKTRGPQEPDGQDKGPGSIT